MSEKLTPNSPLQSSAPHPVSIVTDLTTRATKQRPKLAGKKRKRGEQKIVTKITEGQTQATATDMKECGICLEIVKRRGLLDSCDHLFCFSCISRWLKRSSSCPHCKREVRNLRKADPAGKVESAHSIRRRALRDTLDREEFQQRRRQASNRANGVRAGARYRQTRQQQPPLNGDLTRQLLSVHQVIRDNMTRLSSGLRGLQDNLNSLAFLNAQHPQVMPLSFNLCNLPTFAANINVTVNGRPVAGINSQPNFPLRQGYSESSGPRFPPRSMNGQQPMNNVRMQQQMQMMQQQMLQQQMPMFPSQSQAHVFFNSPQIVLPDPHAINHSLEMVSGMAQNHLQSFLAMSMEQGYMRERQEFPPNLRPDLSRQS